jgi:hypothetical protein
MPLAITKHAARHDTVVPIYPSAISDSEMVSSSRATQRRAHHRRCPSGANLVRLLLLPQPL